VALSSSGSYIEILFRILKVKLLCKRMVIPIRTSRDVCIRGSFMMCATVRGHRKMCRIRLFKEFEGEKYYSILIDRKIVMFVALLD